jgi:hypothetical protein
VLLAVRAWISSSSGVAIVSGSSCIVITVNYICISVVKVGHGKKSARVRKKSFRQKSEKVGKKSENHDKH